MAGADKKRVVLGFDTGGTKTAAILMDEEGQVLGQGLGGSGNTNFIPLEIANASFQDAIEGARVQAGLETLQVDCVVVGTEPDPEPVAPVIMEQTGAARERILHRKEGECSMVGGLVSEVGLSLICGTGSVGWGRNAAGETSMTSCWGPIGDEGSAYDIARRGVNAAFWAWDGRGPETILVQDLLEMFQVTDLREACTPIYTSPNLRKDFASLAKLVTRAATRGDETAKKILLDCAGQVAHFLCTCAENLGMQNDAYRVASPSGGLVADADWRYFKMINNAMQERHPRAQLVRPKFEAVVGAALIGLKELGVAWTPERMTRIEEGLAAACEK